MTVATDNRSAGQAMYELANELFPITRSLTGPGYLETLDVLEAVCGPFERHRFATGERVFDWTVPREWTIRDAWIKDPDGEPVVTLEESNLHVVGYSAPVHRRIELSGLQAHLHSLPERPEAIPYRTSYYDESWGFCLRDSQRRELREGTYEVLIDADLEPGHIELAEAVIAGESDAEVLLSTYCCHPSLANNELSGPVLMAQLARWLRESFSRPRYTYRFLFGPETIGAIAYLSRFGERLKERLAAGYVVTCVGNPANLTYKRSRRGRALPDRLAEHTLANSDEPFEIVDFYPWGSDERQFCSPGFDLPMGSLMRSPYGTYPEYHTSDDDMSFITAEALGGTLEMYQRIVEGLEANRTWVGTMPYGEPQLGPRGLYPRTGGAGVVGQQVRDMMQVLNLCDGGNDLLAVAERAKRPLWELAPVAERLADRGLLVPADEARGGHPG